MRRILAVTIVLPFVLSCMGVDMTGYDFDQPLGRAVIVSAVPSSAPPYYAGDSLSLTIVGGVAEGATGPDSVVVPNGNPRVVLGANYSGKALMTEGTNTVLFTVHAKDRYGVSTSLSGVVAYTATLRPAPDGQ